jgi:hypothetical protein
MVKRVQFETDIIPFANTVAYQGAMGSCGPNGLYNGGGVVSNLYGDPFLLNRQASYNMYLNSLNLLGQDVGVAPRQFAEAMAAFGVTENATLGYGAQYLNTLPSAADYADAATHKVVLEKIPHSSYQEERLANILASKLLEGKPLLLYYTVSYEFMAQTGPLSQQSGTNYGTTAGGHAVTIMGVDTTNNMLKVASWGEQYGDHGYFNLSLDNFYSAKGGNPLHLWDVYQFSEFDGRDLRWSDATEAVSRAYVAVLDRAPELEGMNWFKGQAVDDIADALASSAEFAARYGAQTDEQFVSTLYDNVLGRAADAGGVGYFTGRLAGGATRGDIVAELVHIASQDGYWQDGLWYGDGFLGHTPNTTDPNIYLESLLFNNRVIAGQDYAITMQADSQHSAVAWEIMNEVTSDPGSIWGVALVGVREQLGYAHIDGAPVS